MAGKIARLASLTSYQLEAEQTIPDLVAVIKELVENSLDANPKSLTITFINFGLGSIIIEDDGDGISPENMSQIASNRYATSKITEETDLDTSLSYGFRGEAIHSIVKLSRKVCILSASTDSGSGICKTFLDFGFTINFVDKPRTKGTTVTIEGLFEGISIRRQDWLKRKSIIFAQSVFLLQSFAILMPNIKFAVFHLKDNLSKVSILHSVGKDFSTRYTECMKNEYKNIENLFEEMTIQSEQCLIEGVAVRHLKESNKNRFVFFINRKPFESPKWQKLFQQMLKKNYVTCVELFLSISLPGLWIDYNVTPDKRTMFILNEADILKEILKFCESKIRSNILIETRDPDLSNCSIMSEGEKSASNCNQRSNEACCESLLNIGSADSVQFLKDDILKLVPVGQFNNGFVICSKVSDGFTELFAVDQHAADERIRFEEIAACHQISCQKLVHPIKIKLALEDEDFVLGNIDAIRDTGFLIRESDGNFVLDALPNFHGAESNIEDFDELLRFMKDHGILYKNLCPKFHRVLASRACRSAVMIGTPLTLSQMQRILYKLSQTDYPWICAHGRPTIQFLKRMIHSAE